MTVAIIDADELCYKIGFGTQHTWYHVFDDNDKQIATMKSSKDAKEYIADAEGFYVEKEVRVLPESVAIRNLKATIRDILLTTGANEYILCMSSPANFRIELATLQEYKGNRSPDSKPVHYPLIKEYFLSEYDTNIIDPYEADDLLAIFYNEIDPDKEGKAIIVTQDKDLLQVPGWFLNLGTTKHSEYGNYGEKFQITEPLGNYNFYSQLISGDTTDNIPGIYQITGIRNSKKFSERLEFLSTKVNERSIEEIEVGMYNHVFNLYLNSLGGKIKCREQDPDLDCILWEIGNLLYMHRSFDDKGWEIPL